MSWRVAKSLEVLRAQINKQWPKRNKAYDGTIGDEAHQDRTSDHNPNHRGVVTAVDITHDPKNGVDATEIVEVLRQSEDPRIKYCIWNGRIFSRKVSPWKWRKNTGHTKHFHLSVDVDPRLYDDISPWQIVRESRGPVPISVSPNGKEYKNIVATMFNDAVVAYQDLPTGWYHRPGVALPYRFKGPRPRVLITNPANGKSIVADVIDVGPWNTADSAYVLEGKRPAAESGMDTRGRKTNLAGIDLNPAAADAIDLGGKAKVTWRYLQ